MKLFMRIYLITILLPLFVLFSSHTDNESAFNFHKGILEYKADESIMVTLAEVDAASDIYIPKNKLYTYKEAIDLRNNLTRLLINNPNSLPINWALMRYYTLAPNFEGGNYGSALEYAGYMYSINTYIGCMAYEYIYTQKKELEAAHDWYARSLTIAIPQTMHWEEIHYNKPTSRTIEVTGNFNNWKLQNMYETGGGDFHRKVLMNKCDNCVFKLILGSRNIEDPTGRQELRFSN